MFLIGQEFWGGGGIIPIIAFSYVIYGVFILQMPSIYLKNKQNWVPYFWGLGFIINISGNYLLIPICGFYGAAITTLLSYCAMTMLLIYKNQRWLPIQYKLNDIMYMLIISFIALYFSTQSMIQISVILIIYLILSMAQIISMKKIV